jgi:hypothetical protein
MSSSPAAVTARLGALVSDAYAVRREPPALPNAMGGTSATMAVNRRIATTASPQEREARTRLETMKQQWFYHQMTIAMPVSLRKRNDARSPHCHGFQNYS